MKKPESKLPEMVPKEVKIEKEMLSLNQTVKTIFQTDFFSHVSTVIKISYDLYHCKYVTDRKTIVLEPNITHHVKHLLAAR